MRYTLTQCHGQQALARRFRRSIEDTDKKKKCFVHRTRGDYLGCRVDVLLAQTCGEVRSSLMRKLSSDNRLPGESSAQIEQNRNTHAGGSSHLIPLLAADRHPSTLIIF